MNERIGLKDTTTDVVTKLSEGNPGALSVCINLLKNTSNHDPDAIMGGTGSLLMLDTLNIYGSRIWMFYKDFCREEIGTMILMLRAFQLGFVTRLELNTAIDRMGTGIDIEEITKKVKEFLPNFNLPVIENNNKEERNE